MPVLVSAGPKGKLFLKKEVGGNYSWPPYSHIHTFTQTMNKTLGDESSEIGKVFLQE